MDAARYRIFTRAVFPAAAALLGMIVSGCSSNHGVTSNSQPAGAPQANVAQQSAELIRQGKLIFDETPKYAHEYVGNKLSCSDCHLQSGTVDYASPMIGLPGLFPMFSERAGHVITLQNRIQECFTRSEAGSPPPEGGAEMQALMAYIDSLSKDEVKGRPYKGRGLVKLVALTGNPIKGKTVYRAQCAACHGGDGAGVPPVMPPVWGPDSYNDGAGMNKPAKMAAFVIHNMPQNHPNLLTPQQAYDVSAYIHSMPRPKFNQTYKTY